MYLRMILLLSLTAQIGCGSSRPLGPLDSRLYGKWESRRGFLGTDTLDFHSDGTLKVTDDDGKKKKSYTSHWYIKDAGKTQIKLSMQAQGKEEFRVRSVKFREDGVPLRREAVAPPIPPMPFRRASEFAADAKNSSAVQ